MPHWCVCHHRTGIHLSVWHQVHLGTEQEDDKYYPWILRMMSQSTPTIEHIAQSLCTDRLYKVDSRVMMPAVSVTVPVGEGNAR